MCTEEFFSGFFCGQCSGNPDICQEICTDADDNCAECVLEILRSDQFTNLESAEFFSTALDFDLIPDGTTIAYNRDTDVNEMRFPMGFCDNCLPVTIVIINRTIGDEVYRIQGMYPVVFRHT